MAGRGGTGSGAGAGVRGISDPKKVSGELFTLTYGALVAQILKDYESVDDVNKQKVVVADVHSNGISAIYKGNTEADLAEFKSLILQLDTKVQKL